MEIDIWNFLLTFAGGGAFVATLKFIQFLVEVYFFKSKHRVKITVEDISWLYNELNQILAKLDPARIVIVKAENGGGIPHIGNQVFSTVLYEVHDNDVDPVSAAWDKRPVDKGLADILSYIVQYDECRIDKGSVQGAVRDIYEAQGIAFSLVYQVYKDEKAFFYMSINFRKNRTFDAKERTLLHDSVNKVRRRFSKIRYLS